jgi:prevent-host-death family protein
MKSLLIAENILPLGEFKSQASRVLREMNASQRPVVITQNGRPAAVLLAPEEFDRLQEQARFITAVQRGLAESKAGEVMTDRQVDRLLDEEFGTLKRK